jgi:hypothetical protein
MFVQIFDQIHNIKFFHKIHRISPLKEYYSRIWAISPDQLKILRNGFQCWIQHRKLYDIANSESHPFLEAVNTAPPKCSFYELPSWCANGLSKPYIDGCERRNVVIWCCKLSGKLVSVYLLALARPVR